MRKVLSALVSLFCIALSIPNDGDAQVPSGPGVQQSGQVTRGHGTQWENNGVIGDSGGPVVVGSGVNGTFTCPTIAVVKGIITSAADGGSPCGGGGGGFPIILGTTAINGGSTTTLVSGLTLASPVITGMITGGAAAVFGNITVTSCSGCGASNTPGGNIGSFQTNLDSVNFGGIGPTAGSLIGWDTSGNPAVITPGANLSMSGATLNATNASVNWPTTGQLVVSNGTNTPAGLAEVDGLCAVGVSGVWATSSCGPPPGSMTGSGPSTIGDVLQANNTGNPLNSATDTGIPATSVVTLTGTQLLTNKTLTTPTINGATLSGALAGSPTFSGQPTFSNALTGSQTTCLGLDSGGVLVASVGACSTGAGPLTTTDGTNTVNNTTTQTFETGFVVGGNSGSATISNTNALNAQTGSSYALSASDAAKTVWMTNGSAVTNTIPAAGGTGLGVGFAAVLAAQTAGDVFTPTTSTVNGLSSIKLGAYQAAGLQSDGTNYQAFLSLPQPATQIGTTFLRDDMTWGTISVTPGSIPLANTHILVGNGSGVAADVAMSGDTSIANTGAVTVGKVNAVSYPASPSTNTVPVVTGSNTVTYEAVPNAALANVSTTVNGQTCTLGSTCTITAAAASLAVGTTTITGGTTAQLLYDNGGVLGEIIKANNAVLSTNGTGVASFSTTLPSGLSAPALTVTGSLTATGLVTNSDLANSATTVNGVTCTLGSTCSVGVSPGGISLTNTHILVGNGSNVAADVAMSQDCTVVNTGVITCLKTNNVAFTTAATTSIGTSGATIPLQNGANTWSGAQTFGEVHGTTYAPSLTSNNYTAQSSDCGKTLLLPTGTTPTLTLPNLNAACTIAVVQSTSTQYTVQAASGGTLVSVNSYTKTKAQYAILFLTIIVPSASAATWDLAGDGA